MGLAQSRDAAILRNPKKGEASEFYWACRAGDIPTVRRILSQSDYNEINRLEPNGSTALHAAVYFGRTEVVRILLLEYGVERHRRNRHNLTAFEEAADTEIRQLFMRPTKDRFYSTTDIDCNNLFSLQISKDANSDDDQDKVPNDIWIGGASNETDSQFHQLAMMMMTNIFDSKILKALFFRWLGILTNGSEDVLSFNGLTTLLHQFFNQNVPSNDSNYKRAQVLFKMCESEKKIYPLLAIYTLETPFVKKLALENMTMILWLTILHKLPTIKALAYQGISYRGLTLSEKAFQAYKWAHRHKKSTLVMKTFSSTSVERYVAEGFSIQDGNLLGVIMEFHFTEPCPTALMLYKEFENNSVISTYPDEKEVLIMPFTMFRVTDIEKDSTDRYVIRLQWVPAKADGDYSALQNADLGAVVEAFKNFVQMHIPDASSQ